MSQFRIINSVNEIPHGKGWVNSTGFKKEIVDENGSTIHSNYNGRSYQVVAKKKKEFLLVKRVRRILLGILLTSVSFGGALYSKKVKNLFTKKFEKIRFGLLMHEKVLVSPKNKSKPDIANKIDEAKRVEDKAEELPFYQASICITSEKMIGKIGDEHEKQLMPAYLTKLTLEKGDPLPMDAKESCLEFCLFNTTDKTTFPEKISLPLALFKGKKDGDPIRLRFEGKLIVFKIDQNHKNQMYAEGAFAEVFARAIRYSETQIRAKIPNFDWYSEFWWAKPGPAFKLDRLNQSLIPLEEGAKSDISSANSEALEEVFCKSEVEGNRLKIRAPFNSFQAEDLEVSVNEDYLIFYAKHKAELAYKKVKDGEVITTPYSKLIKEIDENASDFNDIDYNQYEKQLKQNDLVKKRMNCERIAKFKWTRCDQLQNFNIEKLKSKVETSKVQIENGALVFSMSLT